MAIFLLIFVKFNFIPFYATALAQDFVLFNVYYTEFEDLSFASVTSFLFCFVLFALALAIVAVVLSQGFLGWSQIAGFKRSSLIL
jgi:hypothetical protein